MSHAYENTEADRHSVCPLCSIAHIAAFPLWLTSGWVEAYAGEGHNTTIISCGSLPDQVSSCPVVSHYYTKEYLLMNIQRLGQPQVWYQIRPNKLACHLFYNVMHFISYITNATNTNYCPV